jgi:hypothetical protein
MAAMFTESGDEGVNLFGLLNTVRIFSLTDGPVRPRLEQTLLSEAIEHYRALHKGAFLYLSEEELTPRLHLQSLGFELVSDGMRLLAHRNVIRTWVAYLGDLLCNRVNPALSSRPNRVASGASLVSPMTAIA